MGAKSILSKLLVSNKGEQDRRTPKELFEFYNKEFNFDLDPCTSSSKPNNLGTKYYFTKKQNGLKQDWKHYKAIYINPPFKYMKLWIPKIIREIHKNQDQIIVVLTPMKTETQWFHKILNCKYFREIRFEDKRIIFEGHKDPFIIGIGHAIFKSYN